MRSRTANWFLCKIRYEKVMEESVNKHHDTRWYKSKLQFITIDERSAREKKTSVYYLVEGCSLENARSNIDEVMGSTMIDYTISAVSETAIMDVFEYLAKDDRERK